MCEDSGTIWERYKCRNFGAPSEIRSVSGTVGGELM